MARRPEAGRVKTRLVPPLDASRAARLYAAFLEDMWRLGDGFERTVFWVREDPSDAVLPAAPEGWRGVWQPAGDLGVRLEAAFGELFARGGPVVLVGSDHPDLPAPVLDDALRALADNDVALGPTPDGGFYLIGLREPTAGLLHGIPWSTPDAYASTAAAARSRGLRVQALRKWRDVDTWEDVEALRERLASNPAAAPATSRILVD
jgi:rSAM/selenodomain-associated transferase 1